MSDDSVQMRTQLDLSTVTGNGVVWEGSDGDVEPGSHEAESGSSDSTDDAALFSEQELAMLREMGEEFFRLSQTTRGLPQKQRSRLDRSNRTNRKRTSKRGHDEL